MILVSSYQDINNNLLNFIFLCCVCYKLIQTSDWFDCLGKLNSLDKYLTKTVLILESLANTGMQKH